MTRKNKTRRARSAKRAYVRPLAECRVLTTGHEQDAHRRLKPYRVGGGLEAGLICHRAVRLAKCAVEDLKPAAANAPSCQYLLVAAPARLESAALSGALSSTSPQVHHVHFWFPKYGTRLGDLKRELVSFVFQFQ